MINEKGNNTGSSKTLKNKKGNIMNNFMLRIWQLRVNGQIPWKTVLYENLLKLTY